ncbi:metallophosphoesterase [Sphingobacterium alkalisoli]|uniref:Metallophosphoesterase n=1 Tax=Sphingobacterium alkalisoli TaxID=1874115 RepID=A0A4U0GRD1_9SPHI|nr:FN3 domain-containing metallophosphoesterase family protein [Sphingobacterium alkalisoli]TJY61397.1 metallophosphoesterase [Sphingobacterium alkalisoli]GGH30631.1 hypothetical protein GCM10011418_42840 [Sphingobacterium alkalisoli]
MNNRRNFLKQVSLLSVTAVAANATTPLLAKDFGNSSQKPGFAVSPYLQHLTPTSVYVMFITDSAAYSWIEYESEGVDKQIAYMEEDGLHAAYIKLNKIQIVNLQPGKTYRYRACSKAITLFDPYKLEYGEEIQTEWYSFTTPATNASQVSCVILNDVHDSPTAFESLLSLVDNRPYEFVMLNGDTFDYQTDEQQIIDHLLAPCTQLFAGQKSFIMVRGNHETRGKFRREFKNYFAFPDDRYHFSYKQGPIYWVVLDTGEDKPDDHPVYGGIVDFDAVRERQGKWLSAIVNTDEYKEAAYRIVIMHIPPFHSGEWHGPMHCREVFDPIFRANNVDLVISGHTHRHGVHPPDADHPYPVVIGGGSKDGSRTVIHLEANETRLHLEMLLDDGKKVGEYTLTV